MAVSTPVMVSLTAGDETTVVEGPCILTDLIVAELSGSAPASVVLTGLADAVSLVTVGVAAGQTFMWHGAVAVGGGICAMASMGDVAVTVGYC